MRIVFEALAIYIYIYITKKERRGNHKKKKMFLFNAMRRGKTLLRLSAASAKTVRTLKSLSKNLYKMDTLYLMVTVLFLHCFKSCLESLIKSLKSYLKML